MFSRNSAAGLRQIVQRASGQKEPLDPERAHEPHPAASAPSFGADDDEKK
jgi:hypothetical protein